MALNCDQLRKQDVDMMMQSLLYEFPVADMEFFLPRWLDVLPKTHELKGQIIEMLKELIGNTRSMRDFRKNEELFQQPWLKKYYVEQMDMSSGRIKVQDVYKRQDIRSTTIKK